MTPAFPRRPAILRNGDPACEAHLHSLRLPVPPLELRPNGIRLAIPSPESWRAAGAVTNGADWSAPQRTLKRLVAALRHAELARQLAAEGVDLLLVWRGLLGRSAVGTLAARSLGIPCVFFERGPLPGWLMIDMAGINAAAAIPRDAAAIRRWRASIATPLDWRGLRETLAVRQPRRNLVAQTPRSDWNGEGPFLFVPFQVNAPPARQPDGGWAAGPADLVAGLAAASAALPEGWHLRVKPHPNARGDLRCLIGPHLSPRLRLDADTNALDQLAASRGVVTVNSAMGLEAFFHDKPVITLGDSYYADNGRTLQADSPAALAALLADPEALSFDPQARDDVMTCLFNDYFVRTEDLRAGRFGLPELLDRHARLAALGDRPQTGIMPPMTAATGQTAR